MALHLECLTEFCQCFFKIAAISEEELQSLPSVYLDSQDPTPFQPSVHTNTVRATTKTLQPHAAPWKHHLGFIPDLVVQKTLKVTTELVPVVEVETREHMQDHLLTCIPELKHWLINDMACCGMFFLSIPLFKFLVVGHNIHSYVRALIEYT